MKKKSIINVAAAVAIFTISIFETTVAQNSMDKATIEKSMIKALEWQEAHPIFAIAPTDWTEGAYYTGVARARPMSLS